MPGFRYQRSFETKRVTPAFSFLAPRPHMIFFLLVPVACFNPVLSFALPSAAKMQLNRQQPPLPIRIDNGSAWFSLSLDPRFSAGWRLAPHHSSSVADHSTRGAS